MPLSRKPLRIRNKQDREVVNRRLALRAFVYGSFTPGRALRGHKMLSKMNQGTFGVPHP